MKSTWAKVAAAAASAAAILMFWRKRNDTDSVDAAD
jgi:hypothetical protein